MANFEIHGGNGRLYPITPADKAKEKARMEAKGAEIGADWLQTQAAPDYDGYFNVDATFIEYLSQGVAVSESGVARMNVKGYKSKKLDGTPQLNVQEHWIKEVGTYKKFKDTNQTVTSSPESFGEAPADPFEDDEDIPF